MSNNMDQSNNPSEHDILAIEKLPKAESQNDTIIDARSDSGQFAEFLLQQKHLLEKLDHIIENNNREKKKDFWDAVSSLSGLFTLLSSIVIAWLGVQFTAAYKKQEVRIAEAQTIEKFLPHLTSANESNKRGALLAVYALQNNDLAARLAASYTSSGTIDACETILAHAQGESAGRLRDSLIEAYNLRAYDLVVNNNGSLEQSISDYNRLLELRPDEYISNKWGDWFLASIYTNRGNAYRDKMDYVKADKDYEKTFQIYPTYGYMYMGKAIMYRDRQDFDTAISLHNKSIEYSPYNGECFTRRGETYEKMGRVDKATLDFIKSTEIEPNSDWLYLKRGLFYQRQKENTKAAQDFMEVLALTNNERNRFQAQAALRRLNPKFVEKEKLDPVKESVESTPVSQIDKGYTRRGQSDTKRRKNFYRKH